MRTVESAVEWLRPLVDSKAWDYCVVWKLGDDPSRFIQWLGCCCGGALDGAESKSHVRIKEEKVEQPLSQICRDTYFQHPIRTKACEALAHFPSSMELYSGVHGEVVLSTQPKWITHDNSDPGPSHYQLTGTQVLIPVLGGLIELFAAKNVPQDQNIVRSVMGEFLAPQLLSLIHGAQVLSPVTYPTFKGTSAGSNPSLDSNSACKSKNLITERKRRNRIRDGLFALRALVPKITKMDKAATLGDAADFIVELQEEAKRLEDELKELEKEDAEDLKKKHTLKLNAVHYGESGQNFATSQNQCSNTKMEVQMEVNQIGKRDFLIRFLCEHRRGGLSRLVEGMSSLGLQVIDANVMTSNGKVLNILRIVASKDISVKKLRDYLIQLTERTNQRL